MGKLGNGKIALAVASFQGGGAERVITTLANNFITRGVEVDVIVLFNNGFYKEILDNRIKIVELTKPSDGKIFRKIRAFFRLKAYFNNNPGITVMSTLRSMNVFFSFTKLFSAAKPNLFVREADTLDEIDQSSSYSKKFLLVAIKYFYPRQTGVVANCCGTKLDLLRHMPLLQNKIAVIYNPLDLDQIGLLTANIVKDNFVSLVACGRFVPKKNFIDAISALKLVKKTYPKASLTILGEGPELAKLKAHALALDLADSVIFPGFVANPYEYYARAHVFVQTSFYEGFGYVLAEAMAAGTPVVAYDGRGSMREILDNGRYGDLVPLNNIELIANAIVKTIVHPVDQILLAEAVNRFRSTVIADKYFDLLCSGIESK